MKAAALVPLGDIVEVVGGGTPKRNNPAFYGGSIPWVTPKDMKSTIIRSAQVSITEEALTSSAAKLVPAGSVLVVVRSGVLKHTLPVALNSSPVAINQDMKALVCSKEVYPAFLARLLSARSPEILSWVRGTTADNFPIALLKNLQIALPAFTEQRRIADILDRADMLREQRRATLEVLESADRSLFLELFGDPVANPRGWPTGKLTDLGQLDRGVSRHRPRNAPHLLGGPYPLVQTGEVANSQGYIRSHRATYSEIGLRQSKLWPAGTLCITIAANIAKAGILTFDACFPDSVVGFTAKEPATVEFVRVWLSFFQQTLESNAPEAAQKNINLAILRDLDVAIPSPEKREEFATRVSHVERLRRTCRESRDRMDALFGSLQHRAFRGEL